MCRYGSNRWLSTGMVGTKRRTVLRKGRRTCQKIQTLNPLDFRNPVVHNGNSLLTRTVNFFGQGFDSPRIHLDQQVLWLLRNLPRQREAQYLLVQMGPYRFRRGYERYDEMAGGRLPGFAVYDNSAPDVSDRSRMVSQFPDTWLWSEQRKPIRAKTNVLTMPKREPAAMQFAYAA